MRRKLSLATSVVAVLAFAVGCGNGTTTTPVVVEPEAPVVVEEPQEVTTLPAEVPTGDGIVIWVDETRMGPVSAAADQFTAETGIPVEMVQKNFDDIANDAIAQIPTGEGPDLFVTAHDNLGRLLVNGVIAPITLGNLANDFEPVAIEAFSQDGQLYGVPYAIENIALIRNVDLAPEAPATWDDAIASGRVEGSTVPPILIQSDGENGDPFHFYPLQTSCGAPVFEQNADGSYNETIAMGGENGHRFAEWLAAQGAEGNLSQDITYDIATQQFADGNARYIIGGPWMIDMFSGMNLAIDPIPTACGDPAQPFAGVQGFFLSSQSRNPIAATNFLTNYVASEEVQVALAEAGGRPPALKAAQAAAVAADATGTMQGFMNVGANAVPMPSIPAMAQVWAFWGVTQARIFGGNTTDPDGEWDRMISDIQGAIDANR